MPWYEPDAFARAAQDLAGAGASRLAADGHPAFRVEATEELAALRLTLSPAEQEDLRELGADTAAALRAIQIHADVIVKATSVDGVYSADPKRDPDATRYESISYRDVMVNELGVMDQTAITLCKENKLPIIVLNIHRHGEVAKALLGERVGTIVQ